ncbi:MAG: lamin tail domain-containing protein [Planctomycetes bacterium]|nr:lamin tail domain-containing protein [Planctomycetota bacterium]
MTVRALTSIPLCIALCCVVATTQGQILINAIDTGTPDYVELYNCGGSSVDISGWTLQTFYDTGTGATSEVPFTFPAGTVIAAGGLFLAQELGTAGSPGTLPNSVSVGINYFWVAARGVGALLTNSTGAGVDYVFRDFFGLGGAPLIPAGTNWSGTYTGGTTDFSERNSDTDTDTASDWSDVSSGTPSALNAGQTGSCTGAPPPPPPPPPAGTEQTLPAGFLAVNGGAATSYPQNTTTDHKWQWHYDSGEFQAAQPITITEVWVRASSASATVAAFNFPSFVVTMASSPTDYTVAGHDPVFANNLNSDATVVRSGAWSGAAVPASGGTSSTWIPLGLTSSFTYDPTQGDDFVIQIEKCGTVATWATTMDGSSGTAGVNGGNRYGDTASCVAATHSFNNNEYVPIVKIDYSVGGLSANFAASPTSGPAPLNVQFTDQSTSDDPAGIQSWAWDFENDGTIDSTQQNPAHTYTPGTYTVSLTVTDTVNGSSTRTHADLITVGAYELVVTTTGGGVGDITVTPPPAPPGLIEGYTLASLAATTPVGSGPFLGLNLDPLLIAIVSTPAAVGNVLHFLPSPGLYPAVPFQAPAGFLAAFVGAPIDITVVWIANGQLSSTNVVQIIP